ncbi:MAG: hypothetical protein ACXAEU_00750 [Candidatus Hodarchaeales archaeon]
MSRLRSPEKKVVEPDAKSDAVDSIEADRAEVDQIEVDQVSETIHEKWLNGKFDAKIVVSVTKKDQFKNLRLSVINGREYSTKLGNAMSVQVDPRDIDDFIKSLQEAKKLIPLPEKRETTDD